MLNRRGKKRQRKENYREAAPPKYLIICEGTETEVNYFENIKRIINNRYRSKIIVKEILLYVEGLGRSTKVLVNEALKKRSFGDYSETWVVFDKDDNSDFDEAIKLAKDEGLEVAWSNECFELWLLLHFQDLQSAITRDQYNDKLDAYFSGKYNKNIDDIFDITRDYVELAIKRSEKLIDNYKCKKVNSESLMNPCTTVQNLVKELLPYIEDKH